MWALFGLARLAGRAASAAASGPKRKADVKTTWIAWAVLADLVWACYFWPAIVILAVAVIIGAFSAWDRGKARRKTRSEPDPLAETMARWAAEGRRK